MTESEVPEKTPVLRSPGAGCGALVLRAIVALVPAALASEILGRAASLVSQQAGAGIGLIAGIAGFVLGFHYLGRIFSTGKLPPNVHISHWSTMVEGLAQSPTEFYSAVLEALERRNVPDLSSGFVYAHEAGPLSSQRLYLEVQRQNFVFHVCGAPFGDGFFVSWWLGERRGVGTLALSMMPFAEAVFPWLFRPRTYYEIDTALMFQSLTHSAVLEVVDQLTKAKGLRGPSELERKPISRDFFHR